MHHRRLLGAVLGTLLVLGSSASLAHGGATGIVKERMDLMKGMGKSMKSVSAMMRGEAPYDASRVQALAGQIADQGGEAITRLFPQGSLDMPTEALPAIWQDWQRFESLADELGQLAADLGAAAAGGRDEAMTAFRALGRNCSGCHEDFRQKKEKQ